MPGVNSNSPKVCGGFFSEFLPKEGCQISPISKAATLTSKLATSPLAKQPLPLSPLAGQPPSSSKSLHDHEAKRAPQLSPLARQPLPLSPLAGHPPSPSKLPHDLKAKRAVVTAVCLPFPSAMGWTLDFCTISRHRCEIISRNHWS